MARDIYHTRNAFLFSMSGIYLAAFTSLYVQLPGLYSENGILPAHSQIGNTRSARECLQSQKTLLCLSSILGLNTFYMMELIALIGIFLSFIGLIAKTCRTSLLFGTLWASYLSLYQVGQTFLWFQWDSLLLEIGFLTIVVAPIFSTSKRHFSPRNFVTLWLVRWALFRLMFASGVVKLQSGCPTWWNLTALHVHYESQCIPTPLAWFAHHLPGWIHKLSVVATFVIEIPIPFMFFSPIKNHRLFAFYSQILLQLLITLSGNYNFFNLLTMTMCISLLDDVHLGHRYVRGTSFGFLASMGSVFHWITKCLGYVLLAYYSLAYFSIKLSPGGGIDSEVSFTPEEFDLWTSKAVRLSFAVGAISLLITMAEALTSCVFEIKGTLQKLTSFVSTLIYSHIAIILFGISLVPYSVLHPTSKQAVLPLFHDMYKYSADFHLASSYGLFRHMTGVGGRPEVVLEGSKKLDGPWIEYEFPYKPGKLDRVAPFIVPHQPRVDWQMWFAALGTYRQNPWFISMVYRLLTGEKQVIGFLDRSSPWRQKPPKYIRAQKYLYHYTPFDSPSKNWWKRNSSEEYMPIFSVDHGPLLDYLKNLQLIGSKDVRVKNGFLAGILDFIRNFFNVLENHFTIWSLFIAAIIISFSQKAF